MSGTVLIVTALEDVTADMVIRALRDHQTNPWPDGATFAKVAWDTAAEADGSFRAGSFKQVEFMIKDGKKYASTRGWGWARWVKGTDLEPYGREPSFTAECTNCHQPMEKDDFVFTTPFALRGPAALASNGPFQVHGWRVITSSMQAGAMSTLYGNDAAVKSARSGQTAYPKGAEVSLVTWREQPDEHWFGANVPGALQTVEQVSFGEDGAPSYTKYNGDKKEDVDPDIASRRIATIVAQRASVMP